ncbi:uncharacterized protein LOC135134908 isoform X2 [Zophobas morio]|uniref:uncharacterized protein LOC135134908 isoform X2 n=1 Tax=Zophobas morio TaxID=2755281 RepID=UPI0030829AE5
MEKTWKILFLCVGLLFCELCNGLPINLENTVADSHTQLLTGLVALLLTVCSVVFLAGCLCCQRRNGFKEFRDSPVVASTASNLDHGHINPVANGEFTIFTPLSPPLQNNNVFLANQQIITRTQEDYVFGDVDVSSWFNGTETDFPRIKLKYIKEIGKGWFGRVVEGAAQDIEGDKKWTPVVVRILEATASSRERVVFLHDATIYRHGAHPNILTLFGRCLDTIPLLLLQEYCPYGDLKNYLRKNKSTAETLLSTEHPLLWCCQLSSALKHLHENRLTHPDLAARNCQLTSNLTLKLGDYGLAVFQYPEDYYLGSPGVSVRWCAPESLSYTSTTIEPKKITLEANIWSLGVTMWEIYECGEQPYSSLSDDEVVSQVVGSQKVRLDRPKYQVLYTDYIFRLMQLCWTSSESRPAVAQIDLMLGELLQVYKNTTSTQLESHVSIKDFDKRWESFKPNSIVKTDNHIDNTEMDLEDSQIRTSKPLSPSLNNLHGSLDNLLVDSSESQMESWLENVATKTGDMSYVKGLSDAIKDLDNAIALENSTSSDSSHHQSPKPKSNPKLEFQLGPLTTKLQIPESPNQNDSLMDSFLFAQRTSSGSETEEENWKKKIERGAYTEKVRQKSRSVADLMILTHIDPSESESETPLPSLDYRTNYKNVRYAPKQNLENVGLMFGSEGNLLNVQDTFQDELRKLQEERRDSLLFVPENSSQNNSSENLLSDSARDDTVNADVSRSVVSSSFSNKDYLENSPSKRILQELNSASEIKPANQVFNVFNVTIDNYSPVRLKPSKLEELINFKEDECVVKETEGFEVPKLSDIIQCNSELVNYLNRNTLPFNCVEKALSEDDNSEIMYDSGVEGDRVESTESLKNAVEGKLHNELSTDDRAESPKCADEAEHQTELFEIEESVNLTQNMNDEDSFNNTFVHETTHITSSDVEEKEAIARKTFQVPKLMDLIQDNDELMDYIIAKYEAESLGKGNDLDSLEMSSNDEITVLKQDDIQAAKEFLEEEIKNYHHVEPPKVAFDLSEGQDEAMPNSLTHSSVYTSTPFGKKSLQELPHQDGFCSLNLFNDAAEDKIIENGNSNLYSLETWDNFLGKALDNQNESQEHELFDSFSSEPHSLLFTQNDTLVCDMKKEDTELQNQTYLCCENRDSTFTKEPNIVDLSDVNIEIESNTKIEDNNCWDNNGGGWFLHPQSNHDISGEMTVPSNANTDSYVGFNVDDEIMAAIRTELLNKLPQAQGGSSGAVHDEEEWDSAERNEVFLRYNVYNTPLSPIPEESLIDDSYFNTPRQHNSEDENEDSDWSDDQYGRECLEPEMDCHSGQTLESSIHPEPLHRHTPSQDSCCSNDTLFNLEELTYAVNDSERDNNSPTLKTYENESQYMEENSHMMQAPSDMMIHSMTNEIGNVDEKIVVAETLGEEGTKCDSDNSCSGCKTIDISDTVKEVVDKHLVLEFLKSEREHDCVKVNETLEESNSESTDHLLPFTNKQVAPLPSPEDKPWKQLPASLLSYDKVISQNMLLPAPESNELVPEPQEPMQDKVEILYVNVPEESNCDLNKLEQHDYANVDKAESTECYENVTNLDDFYNEADYVNIVNLENSKNLAEFNNKQITDIIEDITDCSSPDYGNNFAQNNDLIINNEDDERDIFGVLTDIRFSGPSDSQLMTTSFSESNDINDEQDWDSGSDTRSSSSGEFIWKLDDIQPMEGIQEETSSESSGSDDDAESPEFVPSAWDKYATPTKSALRSPERTVEKTEKKKSKGVWFKKQKYHCVYEYPREPESPVLHSYDLWKPQPDYSCFDDWELDGTDPYVPAENSDDCDFSQNYYQPKPSRNINMYQLSSVTDFTSEPGIDDEFFISSSAKPFDMISGLSSQFFPGNWTDLNKTSDNATPDSGVEDITPAGISEDDFRLHYKNVPTLKQLASEAVKKSRKAEELKHSDVLGGLRHTRNKLKLDLPPSPSAFTSNKMFSIEPIIDPVINREKPTFTTFGKSRFLVQHVDTPPDDEINTGKNVSFEALPYKPLQKHIIKEDYDFSKSKGKVESVRGEASLLDSADEDSGIESSTLERKLSNTV